MILIVYLRNSNHSEHNNYTSLKWIALSKDYHQIQVDHTLNFLSNIPLAFTLLKSTMENLGQSKESGQT